MLLRCWTQDDRSPAVRLCVIDRIGTSRRLRVRRASRDRSISAANRRNLVRSDACPLEAGKVLNRRRRNRSQSLAREEALVPGDENVGECQQARENIVLDHVLRQVLEEEPVLLLVDVEP